MDDIAAPVTGTYSDAPREPLITLVAAPDIVRLLQAMADKAVQDDDLYEARQLTGDLAYRLPSGQGLSRN
ncbi:hypothetical protein ACGFW5_01885 [Streptomyces sp. NPDC048416]|uniref:hypothetical protein n=1 Tax=Streptomyces sp. NPDC048416 TaxID=3365546 RepID=UPI00371699DD